MRYELHEFRLADAYIASDGTVCGESALIDKGYVEHRVLARFQETILGAFGDRDVPTFKVLKMYNRGTLLGSQYLAPASVL